MKVRMYYILMYYVCMYYGVHLYVLCIYVYRDKIILKWTLKKNNMWSGLSNSG